MTSSNVHRHPDIATPGSAASPDRFVRLLRSFTVLVFTLAALAYVAFSLHWRMAVDTPVMHYVVFLMHHGLKPYSDITDNNMPGAYLTEAAAMAVFGSTDLAWRVYEFFLMAVLAGSATLIARRWDWVAGVFAAGLFLVLHAAEGPQLAVERELVIGVLLVAATAVLFEVADMGAPPWLMLIFGFASGLAVAIKPTALPLPTALLVIAVFHLRRQAKPGLPILSYSLAGFTVTAFLVFGFLAYFHAWGPFLFVVTHVVPAYRDISRMHLGHLLAGAMPRAVFAIVLIATPVAVHNLKRHKWNWQLFSLAVAAVLGLFSYLAQGKGYVYHRYIFLLFLLLFTAIQIFMALPERGWPKWLACASLLLGLSTVPGHLRSAKAVVGQTSFELTLERDLSHLERQESLAGRVQCFDLVYGCLDALYHLQLVDDTGFTGDMLFFAPQVSAPVLFYRDRFWRDARKSPASVLVVSNGVFAEPNSYDKLRRWPAFEAYLKENYTLALQRSFPQERYTYHSEQPFPPQECDGYRIYLLKGSPPLQNPVPFEPTAVAVGH